MITYAKLILSDIRQSARYFSLLAIFFFSCNLVLGSRGGVLLREGPSSLLASPDGLLTASSRGGVLLREGPSSLLASPDGLLTASCGGGGVLMREGPGAPARPSSLLGISFFSWNLEVSPEGLQKDSMTSRDLWFGAGRPNSLILGPFG